MDGYLVLEAQNVFDFYVMFLNYDDGGVEFVHRRIPTMDPYSQCSCWHTNYQLDVPLNAGQASSSHKCRTRALNPSIPLTL
jgi:hypothetical protein